MFGDKSEQDTFFSANHRIFV